MGSDRDSKKKKKVFSWKILWISSRDKINPPPPPPLPPPPPPPQPPPLIFSLSFLLLPSFFPISEQNTFDLYYSDLQTFNISKSRMHAHTRTHTHTHTHAHARTHAAMHQVIFFCNKNDT